MIRWVLAGWLVVALGSFGVACGGGGEPLTLTQFFSKWEEVSSDGTARIRELNARYPRAFKDDVQQTQDYYAVYVEIFDDTDSRLEDVAAPEEVRGVAEEILATEAKMSAVHHDRLERLADVTTGDELNALFVPNADYEALRDRDGELCRQLVQLAEDYHLVYDANCGQ